MKNPLIHVAAFAAGLLLIAGYTGNAAADSLPATASKLDASGIQKLIVGNTVAGKNDKGHDFEEYYAPDGYIDGIYDHRQTYHGTWHLEGDKFCAVYPLAPSESGCSTVAVDVQAKKVYWINSDGTLYGPAEDIQAGNTTGL